MLSLLLAALAAFPPSPALGADDSPIVAVLSSETGPYQEALAGLKLGWAGPISVYVLSKEEPRLNGSTRVVVTFGSRAALRSYPSKATVIYAMAPGAFLKSDGAIKVWMTPEASALLADLRKVHPGLMHLGTFYKSPDLAEYADALRAAAKAAGITVEARELKDAGDLPDRLRELFGRVDGLWLPPDPLLLNAATLGVLVQFSHSNKIPLFVPTAGLVEQGATASAAPTFREMGRAAGAAARAVLDGHPPEGSVYAKEIELIVNRPAAADIGLQVPEEVGKKGSGH